MRAIISIAIVDEQQYVDKTPGFAVANNGALAVLPQMVVPLFTTDGRSFDARVGEIAGRTLAAMIHYPTARAKVDAERLAPASCSLFPSLTSPKPLA